MTKKIVFVAKHNRSFIDNDYRMLSNNYSVTREVDKRSIQECDIVFCWFASKHCLKPLYYARKFGKRFIVVTGGYDVASFYYGLASRWYTRLIPWYILYHADSILCVSRFNMDETKKVTHNPHVFYVPNSISIDYKYYTKKNIFVTVGFIDKVSYYRKGIDRFIELAWLMPEYNFYHIGKADCTMFPDDLPPNFSMLGYVDNLDMWYRDARFYCQFSRYESFGLSVIEAMNHGCVPIVWDSGALPEIIGEYGAVITDVKSISSYQKIRDFKPHPGMGDWLQKFDNSEREKRIVEIIG